MVYEWDAPSPAAQNVETPYYVALSLEGEGQRLKSLHRVTTWVRGCPIRA